MISGHHHKCGAAQTLPNDCLYAFEIMFGMMMSVSEENKHLYM